MTWILDRALDHTRHLVDALDTLIAETALSVAATAPIIVHLDCKAPDEAKWAAG